MSSCKPNERKQMKCQCKDAFCDTCNPAVPISERQAVILAAIESATVPGVRYWLPTVGAQYSPRLPHKDIRLYGAGDAATLRALEKRGLIARPDGARPKYAFAITGQGVRSLDHHYKPNDKAQFREERA